MCGCTPDEVCDFCCDKLNHGWKSSNEAETGGEAGQLENVDNCSGDDNGCRTVNNVDDVAENLQED